MQTVKGILAVISGYVIFAASALLLFRWLGIDPHADPSPAMVAIVVGYGVFFSFLGGLITPFISGERKLNDNFRLAALIAGFATFSLFKTSGNHYSQVAAIFVFAPASIAGGWAWIKWKSRPGA